MDKYNNKYITILTNNESQEDMERDTKAMRNAFPSPKRVV